MPAALNKDKILEDLNDRIVAHYLQIDRKGNLTSSPGMSVRHLPIKDPERLRVENQELDEFIKCAFGITFPKKVITKGHSTSFNFVADLFYERIKNALGFANRTGGKTYALGVLNCLDMLFKPKCEVASAGATIDQANKCYRYFRSFLNKKWFIEFVEHYEKITGKEYVLKSLQSSTEFANGSLQEIITGSEKGLRSPHPHKSRLDEIDLMDWDVLQTGLSMAKSSEGIRGQNVFISTRQRSNGPMQRMLDTAEEKGIAVYEWDIWESLEKCTRRCIEDPEHGTCPVYTFCKGRAHHCEGFYQIDDFVDKVRLIDREKFETEWENKRPSRHKLVYYNFDNSRHVMTPERLEKMTGHSFPSPHWHRVSSIDFGSAPGHPFVYLKFVQLPTGQWLQSYEYVAEQRLLRDHAAAIKRSPLYFSGDLCYADWDAQDRLELRDLGINTRPAKKDVLTGIDYVHSLLKGVPPTEEPLLYIWHECTYTIMEYGSYSWPVRPDGKPDKTGNPQKLDDHCMDGTRYALVSYRSGSHQAYRGYKR